ncbi:hypothetical protein FOA52_008393 [Chlamydomonas sp. UWO 241]|nr:hypothetical protein FOA52_008393 [Chlamydomonas sp. UWO 241]
MGMLAQNDHNSVAIASAGAISQLVHLLGAGSPEPVQRNPAWALSDLAHNTVTIAAAGIPALVGLLVSGSDGAKLAASHALKALGDSNAEKRAAASAKLVQEMETLGMD